MESRNTIILVGNGFDIANGLKTRFSDFADYYLDKKIIPGLEQIANREKKEIKIFNKKFSEKLYHRSSAVNYKTHDEYIWSYVRGTDKPGLKNYIKDNYAIFTFVLSNSLLANLYANKDKNWFDIENMYFNKLVDLKNKALKSSNKHSIENELIKLNNDFEEIKKNILEYLKTIKPKVDLDISKFLIRHLNKRENIYVINFNYTETFKLYSSLLHPTGGLVINHIHGSLESDAIVFGYGNDDNPDYQEIKKLEIDSFLDHFKTFDYLNNSNYDKMYSEAIRSFRNYEVLVLGHSFGLTDKTLLSEIINPKKCTAVTFFKRKDLEKDLGHLRADYRKLTYSASRVLTNELELRQKVTNFDDSPFFP